MSQRRLSLSTTLSPGRKCVEASDDVIRDNFTTSADNHNWDLSPMRLGIREDDNAIFLLLISTVGDCRYRLRRRDVCRYSGGGTKLMHHKQLMILGGLSGDGSPAPAGGLRCGYRIRQLSAASKVCASPSGKLSRRATTRIGECAIIMSGR